MHYPVIKPVIVNGTELKLVTSIVFYNAKYFPREVRRQVMEDKPFLIKLIQENKTDELLWMESFYQNEYHRPSNDKSKANRAAAHKDTMSCLNQYEPPIVFKLLNK